MKDKKIPKEQKVKRSDKCCAVHTGTRLHIKEVTIQRFITLPLPGPRVFGRVSQKPEKRKVNIDVIYLECLQCGLIYHLRFPEDKDSKEES